MGSKLSKGAASSSTKRLSKNIVETGTKDVRSGQSASVNVPKFDPNQPAQKPEQIEEDGKDPDFVERLKQMGTVQYKEMPTHYKQDNDMLSAIRAREKAQNQPPSSEPGMMDDKPKSQIHPSTIASILQSRKDGEKDDQLQIDYNLDSQFLKSLGERFTIPEFVIEKKKKTNNMEKEESNKEEVVESLYQPEHGGQKPNMEEIRPKKKFQDKSVEL